jgi:hypothetical protein
MHFNNIFIFNTFNSLTNSLNNYNSNFVQSPNIFLNDKYILGECIEDYNLKYIRIWKSKACFNYYFNKMHMTDNLIACLDYTINNDHIKIEYLSISDDFDINYRKNIILNDNDAIELKNSLILYIENIAKINNLNKIIIDVHNNLKYYNKYFKDNNFIITDKRCNDNPFWIETEKIINN